MIAVDSLVFIFFAMVVGQTLYQYWRSHRFRHPPLPESRPRTGSPTPARARGEPTENTSLETPDTGLQVELECVYCGAPVYASDEEAPFTCEHCGSWLIARRPREYEVLCVKAPVATRRTSGGS